MTFLQTPRDRAGLARPSAPVRRVALSVLLLLSPLGIARPQTSAVPAERLAAREWFRQAGFGMFIHWGVYSQL